MSTSTLARLFDRYRRLGSTAALARVFDATAPALLRIARRLTGDLAQAEDAVQSTFLAAIERAASFDTRRPLEPWLVGILVRQVGLLRRSAARVVDPARIEPAAPVDPAQAAQEAELVAAVDAALGRFDARDRALLVPWLSGEARGRELAQRVGVGGSTLRMRLHRGLARLRRALPAGFGAGIVLAAAEREALARSRAIVVDAAARSAVATAVAAGAAGAAAMATKTATGAAVAKLAAAVLVVGSAIGGGILLRRAATASSGDPGRAAAQRPLASAASATTPSAVSAMRAADPVARSGAGDRNESDVGPVTSATTQITLSKPPIAESRECGLILVAPGGAPVADAELRLFDDEATGVGPFAVGRSADDGTFRLTPEQANFFHVVVEKEGFARALAIGCVRATYRVELVEGSALAGEVRGDDGAPVAGATVELADVAARYAGPLKTTSDPEGRYRFDHVAPPLRWIRARSPDGRRVGFIEAKGLLRDPEARGDVVLRESARMELSLRALADGRPVAGACAVVRAGPDSAKTRDSEERGASRLGDLVPFGAAVHGDGDGRVVVDALPAAAPLRVAVAAEGFAPAWRELPPLRAGELREETFELDRPCRVEGFVRDAGGAPLAGAAVTLAPVEALDELRSLARDALGGDPFGFATTSGADGSFELDGLPPLANHQLRFDWNHRVAFAPLHLRNGGDVASGIELMVGLRVPIHGRVVAEDGPAPKGTQVFRAPASDLAQLDADGNFEFVVNSRLEVAIVAIAPGYVHAVERLAEPLDLAENRVVITLKHGGSIEGRVEDDSHDPVAGARVAAWPADPTPDEVTHMGGWLTEMPFAKTESAADGTFRLRGLPERSVRLIVTAAGFDELSIERLEPGASGVAALLSPSR
jgi:RNA polymerase sigma factor (sigma-70 family)